jgi:hypothetical protein
MTTSEIPKSSLPLLILRLRAIVLALGESAASPWWKTEFMDENWLRFLERLYPRTFYLAAIHAAGKAAIDAHDRAAAASACTTSSGYPNLGN